MRTRTLMTCTALLLGALIVAGGGAEESDESVLRRIKEVDWPRAYREQDDALLDRILAPEFQMIDAGGRWSDKARELERVRSSRPTYDSFHFEITRLEVFENGTAIIAGTGHVRGTAADGNYYVRYESSNVLIRRDGRWQAIASHVSGVQRQQPSDERSR